MPKSWKIWKQKTKHVYPKSNLTINCIIQQSQLEDKACHVPTKKPEDDRSKEGEKKEEGDPPKVILADQRISPGGSWMPLRDLFPNKDGQTLIVS